VPTAGSQTSEKTGLGRNFVQMERLGIEALGEQLDLVGVNAMGLAEKALADGEVFEIELLHSPKLGSDELFGYLGHTLALEARNREFGL